MLDIQAIRRILTHRYPFLLLDRVTKLESNKSIEGYKNITVNEPYFTGHLPEMPIMPGVLIVEALAQLCGVLGYDALGVSAHESDSVYVIAKIDKTRYKRPVVPGDRLDMSAVLLNRRQMLWRFECEARVDGELATQSVITVAEKKLSDV